ncbi:MAG: addiction module toxin RelE [Beijerinckiaceae bacterium]|nr:MAG: addiction module toxin RelE [Beijerinckiaceae bacterium]
MSDKPVEWVGSSKDDLSAFPPEVKRVLGQGIFDAQQGNRHPDAKTMKGFDGASVIEICDDFNGDTYRAVYTVKFANVIYVLHAFQKKSKRGSKTPLQDIRLIKSRLKLAKEHFAEKYEARKTG